MNAQIDPDDPQRLAPPVTKGFNSVTRIADDWYVACRSEELRRKPLAVQILGLPIVLFRATDGTPGALLDRCPHRNVPLSLGRVVGQTLECGYHGWQFDTGGACKAIPGLLQEADKKGRCVEAYPVRELDGFIWIYPTAGATPEREPYRFPLLGEKGYTTVRDVVEADGNLYAVAENALDVPHTAFLHRGLFRGKGEPNEIEVVVRRTHDRVEAEYRGEPPPKGLARMILAPGADGVVEHFDRFILPCVVQVEYRLGKSHFLVTTALTPIEEFKTRLYAVISFKLPLPGFLVVPFLAPVARKIFSQDAVVLARQTENLQRFGGEQFVTTQIDVVGPHILKLLKSAERGDRGDPEAEAFEKTFTMIA